jgi:hypothetical protein
MICRHPPEKRITYGREVEGGERCDLCDEPVEPGVETPEARIHDVLGVQVETFQALDGWYWQAADDSDGPFATEEDALAEAACEIAGDPVDAGARAAIAKARGEAT